MKRQIIDTISAYETIIIHRHVRPDPDAYGSSFGLKEILKASYPDKNIYVTGEHEDTLSFLAHPDQVSDAQFEGALIIVTDTANTERIDDQRYKSGAFLIKIDHHPNDDAYGDLLWVNTQASSASEMIYDLFEEGQSSANWQLSDDGARVLFAGIVGDTGRFMFSSTSQKTFDTAGDLIKYNFDRTELFNGMYEVERNLLNLQGHIYQHFVMNENGAAYVKLPLETLREFGVTASETSLLVGSLGNVKGIKAWIIFIEEEDQIRVRLRSKGPVINELAKQYGGGGHPLASGASVYNWKDADEVIAKLNTLCE
ncbi:bifunctional oligoribonuclease/PAP phosphatase NrnA [Paenisporosarcina quisquiliarum]|uniref:Bifunctional oligoribonuclease/PAP phosphatase NrnA n=1 Tax=Paenisporosarcina quisquiliarum TaxID=365346 RepID=A0A9X3LE54_9BACL|nr:bifunctional oligoribonuclease/PAP phosphatase NrnA [Paenisporosarcina quisquiliarum]MCZ8536276.1 bifunctional oligoribonuclease/PAP phosphatase NrnA [Paenisporosarcina quisquiliarum]